MDLNGSAVELAVGEVRTADARVLLNGISIDEEVAFISSAPGIVSVDPAGVLRAVGQGRATIRATARNQSDSLVVTVGPGLATSVSAAPSAIAFDALTATQVASVQAINQFGAAVPHSAPVQWRTSDENVATVSSAGVIKAVGAGTTQVVGTSGTHTFTIPVAVSQVVTSLEIAGQVPRVFRGERAKINAIVRDRLGEAVESAHLAWSSQNEAVATVDQDGWVLGRSAGFTVISVALVSPTSSAPGSFQSYVSQLAVSAVVPITVELSRLQSVSMDPASATVILGESFPAALTVLDNSGAVVSSGYEVDWSSTDQSVAVVDANGLVTATGAGTAEIIATVEGLSGVTLVQVLAPFETPNLSLLGLTPTSATFAATPFTVHSDVGLVVSEWQVAPVGSEFTNPVVAREETGIALSSYGVGGLSPATMYEARVRYKDNRGNTSKWSEPIDFTTPAPSNSPPAAPAIASVTGTAATTAVLNGSAFSDPDAASTHQMSQWQVDLSNLSFVNPVVDSGESSTALTSFGVVGLTASTTYKARVRYRDNDGNWSSWSTASSFATTVAPVTSAPPNTPSVASVSSIAQTSAILNASAFSDPDAGNTHQSSEWQIDLSGGSFASPVVSSGVTGTALRSYGASGLLSSTGYRARVRYRDNQGTWSSWSTPYSFTTAAPLSGGGGSSGGSVFQSNWSTALGTSDYAQGDGGRWNKFYCTSRQIMEVIPGGPKGWTATPNVLQITNQGSQHCRNVENNSAIPANADDYYLRLYVRLENVATGAGTGHSVSMNTTTPIQGSFWKIADPVFNDTYSPAIGLANKVGLGTWGYRVISLNQNEWYRFEFHVEFFDPANPLRFRIWPYVYNMAGTLIADASDYITYNWPGTATLADDYAAGGYGIATNRDLSRVIQVGYEGTSGNEDVGGRWYYAGVEVRTDRLPGPIQ